VAGIPLIMLDSLEIFPFTWQYCERLDKYDAVNRIDGLQTPSYCEIQAKIM
jgi:hypothetical protein